MAQTDAEIARDMVVAILSRVREFNTDNLKDHSTEIGTAIAEVYKEVFKGVYATYQEVIVDRKK